MPCPHFLKWGNQGVERQLSFLCVTFLHCLGFLICKMGTAGGQGLPRLWLRCVHQGPGSTG